MDVHMSVLKEICPCDLQDIGPLGLLPKKERLGSFCLDLGHIAWIWAIWQNLGQNRPKGDKALRIGQGGMGGHTDGCMYRRTDSPCVQQDFAPFRATAQKRMKEIKKEIKVRQRPPEGNIFFSKRVKMEILNEWK